ncbi:DinB family protein [Flavobacterium sp.]|uniref:DinB family protein n=1 Tax=Flavobacterium sp. TaxID=239 RepID=UPI0025BF659B|nr:DinB family protein [Flavobacterium sp.]MBA4154101.1 hypothetical protein [Flavobacterium sp.]
MLLFPIRKAMNELNDLLNQLTKDDYVYPCSFLSNASIGQHTRHIIEMFQCLNVQYSEGVINYDSRKRDRSIETDINTAKAAIENCLNELEKPNKYIRLVQMIEGYEITTESNYYRELLYNLEHCIHHQALIKVAVLQNNSIVITESFGVAPSTIEYRKQCAQ